MMGDLDDIHLITVGVDKAYDTQISLAEMPRLARCYDTTRDTTGRSDPARLPARARRDLSLKADIARVHAAKFDVYGVRARFGGSLVGRGSASPAARLPG